MRLGFLYINTYTGANLQGDDCRCVCAYVCRWKTSIIFSSPKGREWLLKVFQAILEARVYSFRLQIELDFEVDFIVPSSSIPIQCIVRRVLLILTLRLNACVVYLRISRDSLVLMTSSRPWLSSFDSSLWFSTIVSFSTSNVRS